jgi:hypothetical protein
MPPLVVMTRMRPMSAAEREQGDLSCFGNEGNTVTALDDNGNVKSKFPLDDLFWMDRETQKEVYDRSGALATEAVMRGLNSCVFAYGQTGSGKTHTMMGSKSDPGILPRTIADIFTQIETSAQATRVFEVDATFFEVYNEQVRDLLDEDRNASDAPPKIRKHPSQGVFIEGLQRVRIQSAEDALRLIDRGMHDRAMSSTLMNARSSRSHAVFNVTITCSDGLKGTRRSSAAHLIDLAGSERLKQTGATGTQLEEAKNINQSLFALRRVLDQLASNAEAKKRGQKPGVVPYRDSVLTHVLSDSLGGKSYCLMLAMISPHACNYDDSISTLKYAARARQIVLNPKVNEQQDAALLQKAMQAEIDDLRHQLTVQTSSSEFVDRNDIEMEISVRMDEVERIRGTQSDLEGALAEYRERERRMNNELAAVEREKNEMKVQLTVQKQERFAEAFRNAFRISKRRTVSESAPASRCVTPPADWVPLSLPAPATVPALPSATAAPQVVRIVHQDPVQMEELRGEIKDLRTANANLQQSVLQLIEQMCARSTQNNDEPRLTPSKSRKFVDLGTIVEEQRQEIATLHEDNEDLRRQLLEHRELQQELMSQLWVLQRRQDRSSSPSQPPESLPPSRSSSMWTVSESNSTRVIPRLPLQGPLQR